MSRRDNVERLRNAQKKQNLEGNIRFYSCSFPESSPLMFLMAEVQSDGIYKQNDKGSNRNMLQNI